MVEVSLLRSSQQTLIPQSVGVAAHPVARGTQPDQLELSVAENDPRLRKNRGTLRRSQRLRSKPSPYYGNSTRAIEDLNWRPP